MIREATPNKPSIPILIKKFIFTPLINNNTIIVITITTPVPKSGSNIIRPNTNKSTPNMGNTPFFIFFITFGLSFQTMLNLMVVVGLIPVTGVTLPFLSYGGSSLLITMCSMGILLNISSQNK